MSSVETKLTHESAVIAGLAVALGGAATILGAWFFQYGLGLAPCPLCLEQRWPYYIAIPIALLIFIAATRRLATGKLLAGGLAVVALVMLYGSYLGAFHAGVEWGWWAGPQDCVARAGGGALSGGSLLQQMQKTRVVPCDQAAWRFLGLSLAGYNALISLGLAAIAGWGAVRAYGSSSESQ